MYKLRLREGQAYVHLRPVVCPDIYVQIADILMCILLINEIIVTPLYQGKIVVILLGIGLRENAGLVAKQTVR